MRRSEMVEKMVYFHNTIPDNASTYHEMDMLLSYIQRLGMLPPETYMKGLPKVEGNKVVLEWDVENEEE